MNRRYTLTTCFRYEYPSPISSLRQHLVVTPPGVHGAQHRVRAAIEASEPCRRRDRIDAFGNEVVELFVPSVDEAIEFCAEVVVERDPWAGAHVIAPDDRYLVPSRLTRPDAAVVDLAASLSPSPSPSPRAGGRALAEDICAAVHGAIRYEYGATSVATTAAEALALGRGVCQDSAHVMLAVCRQAGLAARYVSGHLLGEGASHAWVEVLLDEGARGGSWTVLALDPCNGREVGDSYLTVAVGRDYGDVPPTSGSYTSPHAGVLTASKRAEELLAA